VNAGPNSLNVLFEPVAECNCPKNCVRHGHCDECRAFHASAKRPRPPYCEREHKPGFLKRLFGD
jgi:hypothetical protein